MGIRQYRLALHGGADTVILEPEAQRLCHEALRRAAAAGETVLAKSGSAMQGVIEAILVLEDFPFFNAGHGSVLNEEGEHEMDACLMHGGLLTFGSVIGLRTVKHPIEAAAALIGDGYQQLEMRHGRGAELFARRAGLEIVPPDYFTTDAAVQSWIEALESRGNKTPAEHGTVGAVAMDRNGLLVAGTSTGGYSGKPVGRTGDSPIPGAGTYADSDVCAVSCTGTGEHFIRILAARRVYRWISEGMDAQTATKKMLELVTAISKGKGWGGAVVIDHAGRIATPFTSPLMYRAWVMEGGKIQTAIF